MNEQRSYEEGKGRRMKVQGTGDPDPEVEFGQRRDITKLDCAPKTVKWLVQLGWTYLR